MSYNIDTINAKGHFFEGIAKNNFVSCQTIIDALG